MNLETYLTRVLPADGAYYVGSQKPNSKYYNQTPVETIQDAAGRIDEITSKHENAFVAIGSYKDTSSRKAKNILYKKSFYMDLDCGPTKDFSGQADAVTQLMTFCTTACIPRPNILIKSGSGIHAYWVLKESVSIDVWQPIADALKNKCNELNFPADPAVTADATRILRPPETVNYKDAKNPLKVSVVSELGEDYNLDRIATPLGKATVPDTPVLPADHEALFADGNAALSDGVGHKNVPHYAKYIVDECPVMQDAKLTGGEGYKELLWSQQLNLLAFCDDGSTYIHAISDGHKEYTAGATNRKFETKLAAKASGNTGPTLCKTFEQFQPELCAGCPHQNSLTSPIQLGLPPVHSGYPQGWSGSRGWTFRLDEEGEAKGVFPVMFEEVKVFESELGYILAMTHKVKGVAHTAEIHNATLQHDKRTAAMILSASLLDFTPKQMAPLGDLMMAWMNQIKKSGGIRPAVRSFGWVNQKKTGFAAGDTLYWDDNTQEAVSVGDPMLRRIYQPLGDLEPWKKAAQGIVDSGSIELQIGLASAFAAPLVRFTQVKGVMLSLMSAESGTGKSTCLQVAQSVWGCPHQGINALNDTVNSVAKKLGMLNNIPAYWDELRMKDNVERFIQLTFQLGQGKDKSRLTANSTMMETGTWNTLITCATNEPLNDHVEHMIQGTDAGAVRILEIEVPVIRNRISETASIGLYRPVELNYGLAGAEYAKYLAANKDKVSGMVSQVIDKLSASLNTSSAERFWVSTIAVTLVGASIAKSLGLVQFDTAQMATRLTQLVRDSRKIAQRTASSDKTSLSEVVGEFMRDHQGGILQAPEEGERIDASAITEAPRRGVVGRVSGGIGVLNISQKAFRAWLYLNGYPPSNTVRQMKDELAMGTNRRIRLGAWGRQQVISERVYTFDMENLDV